MKNLLRLFLLPLLLGALYLPACADVSLRQTDGHYILENEFVRLAVDPAKGGVIDDYFVKATKTQMVSGSLFMLGDHFWQQTWPGEFLNQPYDAKIIEQSPDVATLEVARTSEGYNGNATQSGLRVVRRMTLRAGSPVLSVEVELQNTAKVGRTAGYWTQSLAYAGGDKAEKQLYFRPSLRAVSEASYKSVEGVAKIDPYGDADGFVRDPQNGWMAALGADSKTGLAFAMRYDELLYIYNSFPTFTSEWQYKNVAIPAGKSWQTSFEIYPLGGWNRVDYASKNLVAAAAPRDENGQLTVPLQVATSGGSLENVEIEGTVTLARTGKISAPLAAQKVARLDTTPQTLTFRAPHDPSEPVQLNFTIRAQIAGKPIEEKFSLWFGAQYGKNWQIDGSPLRVLPAPERHVTFLKPDVIEKFHNATPRVLQVRGMFASEYLPDGAFAPMKAQITPSYYKSASYFPASLSDFPASYEELMAWDVIALINVDAGAVGDAGQEMLKDFVNHGGTLVYGGDIWAFGRGNLGQGQIAELLPVTFPAVVSGAPRFLKAQAVSVAGSPLAPNAVMMYAAAGPLTLKKGARVLASAGGEPVLVEWKVGQGRVIALTGSALGEAPKGKTLFTRTPQWAALLSRVLQTP